MGDRAVYCARLESVCAFTGTRGSNPRPSAINLARNLSTWRSTLRIALGGFELQFDWWGALGARVQIPQPRDLNPEPSASLDKLPAHPPLTQLAPNSTSCVRPTHCIRRIRTAVRVVRRLRRKPKCQEIQRSRRGSI